MCGISGMMFFDSQRRVDRDVVDTMRHVARHRGPDDHGHFFDHHVGLSFNRLSIIDLSAGHQPMSTDDGAATVVFNGEIYNFQELRQELIGRGCRFRTRSDTEVILHSWLEYGEACVEKLRGMFAFVIWDSRQRVLFGARDRLGIKPFYYYTDNQQFCFASELKSLLAVPGMVRDIDPAALAQFLEHRYVIAPQTIFHSIHKLPPGHLIRVTAQGCSIRRYWSLPTEPPRDVPETQALEELNALLDEVMRLHLISDVPLGAFLSGGLDSSAVVALMAKRGVADIKTFSVGYDSPESELPFAKRVAEHCRSEHHPLLLTPEEFRDTLPRIVWFMDEPVGDEASLPLFYLARFARQKVTVALSGEGSDEIFSGYDIYRRMLAYERWNRIPGAGAVSAISGLLPESRWKRYSAMFGTPLESRHRGVSKVFSPSHVRRLLRDSNLTPNDQVIDEAYSNTRRLHPLTRMAHVDINTWLADDLLVKADRMSMANSLELRVPFLDHKLVEFAMRLPLSLKVRNGSGKYLLKRSMEALLPHDIVHRTKKGFPVPTKSWFRGELANFARETLLAGGGVTSNFLNRAEVEGVLAAHRVQDASPQLYSLLVLDQWYRQFGQTGQPLANDALLSPAST